jgi:HD-GYP domain-containing protein (c-di-GMP phosphodiesterase class II)
MDVQLSEVMAALSLATDVAMGIPLESGLAVCLGATGVATRMGLDEEELRRVYYLALLRHIGCTAGSDEIGRAVGDEVALRGAMGSADFANPREMLGVMRRHIRSVNPPAARPGAWVRAMRGAPKIKDGSRAVCEVAQMLADRMGFDEAFQRDISMAGERFDGKGFPGDVGGSEVSRPSMIVQAVELALTAAALDGPGNAAAIVERRSGAQFDPVTSSAIARHVADVVADAAPESPWEAVVAAEPGEPEPMDDARLDDSLRAVADFADLKSPYLVGHSSGVAELAAAAAERAGLPPSDVATVRRAGWVHDVGRVGVPSMLWGKTGPLSLDDWERIRMHAYHTDRILSRPEGLRSIGRVASMHHERCDGSGYFRGSAAAQQPAPARILAAADAFHAMTSDRPHRSALSADRAAAELQADVKAWKLDADAAAAVLEAAGRPVRRRRDHVGGLTAREIEVLRLLARGRSIREIAKDLVISPKTADAHIQHIYAKAGVSTRAAATLFAMQHDLLATQ